MHIFYHSSTRIIGIGFSLVITLMVALIVLSLSRLSAINQALDQVAEDHNHYSALAYTMARTSRERSFLLYNTLSDPDPFSRDEKIQQLYALGTEFGQARQKLLASRLLPEEREMLESQGEFTSITVAWHQEILDLLADDKRAEALRIMQDKAMPAQARAFEVINAFFQLQIYKTRNRVAATKNQAETTRVYLMLGGSAAFILTLLVAVFVSRSMKGLMTRLNGTTHKLEESIKDLEFQKQALDEHAIVSITDADGRITYVNKKFCEVFQYSVEELLGQDHRILNSGVHPKELFTALWQAILDGHVWHGEVCNRRKDGRFCWVESTIRPVLDASGKPCQFVAIRTEITRVKEAEQVLLRSNAELEALVGERASELKEREEVLSLITNSAHDAIVMVDDSGNLTYWNIAANTIFGYSHDEVMGKHFLALVVPPESLYREHLETNFKHLVETGSGYNAEAVELKIARKGGAECFVELFFSAVQIKGRWHGIGIARDITDRKQVEENLKLQATTDALTGIANRRLFDSSIETEISRATRHQLPLALMIMDIDHFKQINDDFGHQAGDQVLVALTQLISEHIRADDFFVRWGGEEFVILSPGIDAENMRLLAEKLRTVIENHVFPGVDHLTCSFGLAEFARGESIEHFIRRADAGLYRAKANGRNRVEMQ